MRRIIPWLGRLGRAPLPPFWTNLPLHPITHLGRPDVPVNVAFVGSRDALLAAFRRIGWVEADALSTHADLRLAAAALLRRPYPRAPVSRLYLFGRMPDLALERELDSVARRDHVRVWHSGRHDVGQRELWLANASRDQFIELLRRHHLPLGTTHHIDPDLDAARSRLVRSLRAAGAVARVMMRPGIGATPAGQDANDDPFYTDGRIAVIVLHEP